MRNDRGALVSIAALCMALVLAACTSDDAPPASATGSPGTETATASPTAVPRTATATPPPAATRPPEPTPPPQPPPTPGRFTIQLFDFDEPGAIEVRRRNGTITATADGVACTTVDADALEPPAIVLGGPDQPEECRREGAWVAFLASIEQAAPELWVHFRLHLDSVALLGNYATGTPSEWPETDGAGVFEHAGVLVVGFEIGALYEGNCPVASPPTWISPPEDLPFIQMVIDASGARAPDPVDIAMYRVVFFGEISAFGNYGPDELYRYEIVPTNLGSAELADDCDWAAASQYRDARARWRQAAIQDYRFTLQRHCECPPEWSAPTEVTVRAGLVSSASIEGTPAPEGAALTIAALLDEIATALNEPVATTVTYHPELGYPLDVQLDLEAIAVDGGLSLTVSDLERLD